MGIVIVVVTMVVVVVQFIGQFTWNEIKIGQFSFHTQSMHIPLAVNSCELGGKGEDRIKWRNKWKNVTKHGNFVVVRFGENFHDK